MNTIKHTGKAQPWDDFEITTVINLYNQFLQFQRTEQKYQKAAAVRLVMAATGRSKGSVEAKLMNISGARVALELDYVSGYKPLANMQAKLREAVKAGAA